MRGNLFLQTDAAGKRTGQVHEYSPFGEPLAADGTAAPDNVPDNQPGQLDNGWLGQHQRPYEHAGALALVQMGARPYLPLLGRFLSVDPIEGGSANDYDYVVADPLNKQDLDGKRWGWIRRMIGPVARATKTVIRGIGNGAVWLRKTTIKLFWRGVLEVASWRHNWRLRLTNGLAQGTYRMQPGNGGLLGTIGTFVGGFLRGWFMKPPH
ncbi:RHS repeat domain-containing protein [Nocardia sp. NRRL S-836]|uniref:RHS repeat domain-containing protein n=1 Tax=Nocardia sp. NRRL S-836 TaxID=1519492 RepID=UPI0009E7C8E3|nr:RHS repeat-associated core domain-containing protein [Nocardia sp. NRRL S-836]